MSDATTNISIKSEEGESSKMVHLDSGCNDLDPSTVEIKAEAISADSSNDLLNVVREVQVETSYSPVKSLKRPRTYNDLLINMEKSTKNRTVKQENVNFEDRELVSHEHIDTLLMAADQPRTRLIAEMGLPRVQLLLPLHQNPIKGKTFQETYSSDLSDTLSNFANNVYERCSDLRQQNEKIRQVGECMRRLAKLEARVEEIYRSQSDSNI